MKIFLFALILGCSSINQESQENYKRNHMPQHGFLEVAQQKTQETKVRRTFDQAAAKRGKILYQSYCYHCHGVKGQGDGPYAKKLKIEPTNLYDAANKIPSFKFYIKISQWKGEMPGWKNHITEQELTDLENYIKALSLDQLPNE